MTIMNDEMRRRANLFPEMSALIKVLTSLENSAGDHCVDIFVRVDGTFGFEDYRRDSEGERG